MKNIKVAILLFFITFFLFQLKSMSASFLEVGETINVFKKPEITSDKIGVLNPGERVPVSNKTFNGFKKIAFVKNKKRTTGYVEANKFELSWINNETESLSSSLKNKSSQSNFTIGLSINYSFLYQPERRFVTTTEDAYQISSLKSSMLIPSIIFEKTWSPPISYQVGLVSRRNLFKGSAKLEGTGSTNEDIVIEQKYIGFNFIRLRSNSTKWRTGYGFEYSRGLSSSVESIGESDKKPNYFSVYWTAQYLKKISPQYSLNWNTNIGINPISQPVTLVFESGVSFGITF